MTVTIQSEPIPLTADQDGILRVGGTRVTLDIIVDAFRNQGASAEEIALQYPSLHLADIYAVIAYYLRHADELDEYLRQQRQATAATRLDIEQRFDSQGMRARLQTRLRRTTEASE